MEETSATEVWSNSLKSSACAWPIKRFTTYFMSATKFPLFLFASS